MHYNQKPNWKAVMMFAWKGVTKITDTSKIGNYYTIETRSELIFSPILFQKIILGSLHNSNAWHIVGRQVDPYLYLSFALENRANQNPSSVILYADIYWTEIVVDKNIVCELIMIAGDWQLFEKSRSLQHLFPFPCHKYIYK